MNTIRKRYDVNDNADMVEVAVEALGETRCPAGFEDETLALLESQKQGARFLVISFGVLLVLGFICLLLITGG